MAKKRNWFIIYAQKQCRILPNDQISMFLTVLLNIFNYWLMRTKIMFMYTYVFQISKWGRGSLFFFGKEVNFYIHFSNRSSAPARWSCGLTTEYIDVSNRTVGGFFSAVRWKRYKLLIYDSEEVRLYLHLCCLFLAVSRVIVKLGEESDLRIGRVVPNCKETKKGNKVKE